MLTPPVTAAVVKVLISQKPRLRPGARHARPCRTSCAWRAVFPP